MQIKFELECNIQELEILLKSNLSSILPNKHQVINNDSITETEVVEDTTPKSGNGFESIEDL